MGADACLNMVFYRYGSICEPDMIDAFKSAGLKVFEIDEEIKNKEILPSRQVELVDREIRRHGPLFVFSINFFPALAEICSIHGTFYLCQTVDSPVNQLFSRSITKKTNRIFLFDKGQYRRFHGYNEGRIFHLPLSANVERYDRVISSIGEEDRKKYSNDIAFVGSLYSEKNDLNKATDISPYTKGYIDGLINSQKSVYGAFFIEDALNDRVIKELKEIFPELFRFDKAIEETDSYIAANSLIAPGIAERERVETLNMLAKSFKVTLYTRSDRGELSGVDVRGGVSTHLEMPKIFNLSKINLNMTVRSIESGLPLRIFDIMACGGFVITNYQEELSEHFEVGKEVEMYSDPLELKEKCDYYLRHDEERRKIAQRGYEKVKNEHSCKKRVKDMIERVVSDI
ncbi:MAG: glycosyltransferase [Lachnospiraceae bacterium]|nr:glycosyltransferase [Lachnospiraceae bacterium]